MTDFEPLDTFRASVVTADEERSARIRDEFRARIATMATDDDGRRPFDPPRRERRRAYRSQPALALAVLALILGLAAGGAFWMQEGRSATLPELATAAANQPDVTLADGEYLHRVEQVTDDEMVASVREQWTSKDGTGQTTTDAWRIGPAGSTEPSMTVYPLPGSLRFADLSYDQLRQLPTDPDQLLERLNQLGVPKGPRAAEQAEAMADVLALDITPPDVVAAGIHALGRLGGLDIGRTRDGAGRVGIGVRGDNEDGTVWLVVLDPVTGRAIAFSSRVDGHDVISPSDPRRVWTDQAITSSLPLG